MTDVDRLTTPGFFVQAWLVLQKDIRIELRTGEIVVTGGFFGALLAVLTSIAFYTPGWVDASGRVVAGGSDRLSPGAIWLATAFSAVLAIGRTWHREREDGALEALLAASISKPALFIGKAAGVLLFLLTIDAVVVPVVALLLHLDLVRTGAPLVLLLVLAAIGVAAAGTLFGAMTVRTRARELVLAAVLFPLLSPTLVLGVSATRELIGGADLGELADSLKLLLMFDVLFVVGGALVFDNVLDA